MSAPTVAAVRALLESGVSVAEAARRLGCTPGRVRYIQRAHGLEARARPGRKPRIESADLPGDPRAPLRAALERLDELAPGAPRAERLEDLAAACRDFLASDRP